VKARGGPLNLRDIKNMKDTSTWHSVLKGAMVILLSVVVVLGSYLSGSWWALRIVQSHVERANSYARRVAQGQVLIPEGASRTLTATLPPAVDFCKSLTEADSCDTLVYFPDEGKICAVAEGMVKHCVNLPADRLFASATDFPPLRYALEEVRRIERNNPAVKIADVVVPTLNLPPAVDVYTATAISPSCIPADTGFLCRIFLMGTATGIMSPVR